MKKLLTTLSILLIATAAFAQTYTVERVIDGDTIKLTNGEEVQLIGIKAPEDEKMGQEATKHLKAYIVESGMKVLLENDIQERDNYGRLSAYVFVSANWNPKFKRQSDMQDIVEREGIIYWLINAKMVRDGYATPMTISPNVRYADVFKKLYEEAREQKRGLWGVFSFLNKL